MSEPTHGNIHRQYGGLHAEGVLLQGDNESFDLMQMRYDETTDSERYESANHWMVEQLDERMRIVADERDINHPVIPADWPHVIVDEALDSHDRAYADWQFTPNEIEADHAVDCLEGRANCIPPF